MVPLSVSVFDGLTKRKDVGLEVDADLGRGWEWRRGRPLRLLRIGIHDMTS